MLDLDFLSSHYQLPIGDIEYLCRNKTPYCKCGALRKLSKSSQSLIHCYLSRSCGNPKCEPNYGRKRPDHSEKMKYLSKHGSVAYKESLIQPGEVRNKEVNSINFKRKRLINNGYNCEGLSDLDILTLFREMQSDWRKSCKKRKKEILQRVRSWEPEYIELVKLVIGHQDSIEEWLETLTDNDLQYYWTRIHGINTIRNWNKVKRTRKTLFKQSRISGFEFNTGNQRSIFLKSGLEQKYVEFFEKMKIPWCYELIKIETINCSGFYIPDFLIEIDGKQIVLEVKGDFYNQPYDEYYQNKILAGIKFCKIHSFRYVLTQKNPDAQYNFLTNALIDTEKDNVRN